MWMWMCLFACLFDRSFVCLFVCLYLFTRMSYPFFVVSLCNYPSIYLFVGVGVCTYGMGRYGIVCNMLYYGMACDLISCHFVIPHVMCVWMNA